MPLRGCVLLSFQFLRIKSKLMQTFLSLVVEVCCFGSKNDIEINVSENPISVFIYVLIKCDVEILMK